MVSKEFNMSTLRVIPLFCKVSEEALEDIRPALKVAKLGEGEVVVKEGDAADKLFVLVSGEVQIIKNYLEPGAQTVDVLKPGSYFGEMALVGEPTVRSATAVTAEKSHFVTLDREAFRAVLLRNPEMAVAILEETFRRLRQANELIASLQQDLG
jgi:CRP-like cAMP-binding protein